MNMTDYIHPYVMHMDNKNLLSSPIKWEKTGINLASGISLAFDINTQE